ESAQPDDSAVGAVPGGQGDQVKRDECRVSRDERMERKKHVKRTITVLTFSSMLLALCLPAAAQRPTKVTRLGYLSNTDAATDSARAEGIRLALRDLGYIEGQNIATEYRYAEGRPDRAPEHAAELVRLKVDIIVVASGDPWIRAAKNATKRI